jgi:hypothetical protein
MDKANFYFDEPSLPARYVGRDREAPKYPKPPRPVFTDFGGVNPTNYTMYVVLEEQRKLLVDYSGHRVTLEGRPAAHFLNLLGDARAKLFETQP